MYFNIIDLIFIVFLIVIGTTFSVSRLLEWEVDRTNKIWQQSTHGLYHIAHTLGRAIDFLNSDDDNVTMSKNDKMEDDAWTPVRP